MKANKESKKQRIAASSIPFNSEDGCFYQNTWNHISEERASSSFRSMAGSHLTYTKEFFYFYPTAPCERISTLCRAKYYKSHIYLMFCGRGEEG
jgi:hypothetical protein